MNLKDIVVENLAARAARQPIEEAEPSAWTIMVYMAGDNNLSENMAFSLVDIGSSMGDRVLAGEDAINVLTYFDGSSLTAPTHYTDYSRNPDQEGPIQPFRQTKLDRTHNHENTPVTEAILDRNSASAYSILNFIHWCIIDRKRTAKNYALIFSGHSFGFHGTSFLRDDSSARSLTVFRFRWALEQAMERYLGKKPIAILGFDSCVMSMLEVGYEFRKVAQTLVASEGSLPNSGWSYAPMLRKFVTKFEPTQEEEGGLVPLALDAPEYVRLAACGFAERFINHHNSLLIGGRSVDMSAWDLEKIPTLTTAVKELAQELNKHLDLAGKIQNDKFSGGSEVFVYQELRKIVLQSHMDSQTYMKNQCVDLKDFCQRLILECKFMEKTEHSTVFNEIMTKARAVVVAVDDCVMKCGYSGDEYQFSNGISIYFPWTYLAYRMTNYRYRYLRFNKGDGRFDADNLAGEGKEWNEFLLNYLSRVTYRRARKFKDGKTYAMDDFSKGSPLWSKENPWWSKENPLWSKDQPDWSKGIPGLDRDNPDLNRDNPDLNKDNPDLNKDNPDLNKDNPDLNKDNPDLNKDNPDLNKDNPDLNKDNPDLNKDNPDLNKDNPDLNKDNPDLNKDNPDLNKDNPDLNKDNPDLNKDNPDLNKDNPDLNKDNPDLNKDNPDYNRDNPDLNRGQGGTNLFYFERYRNFQMAWDINGFSDDVKFDKDLVSSDQD